MIWADFNVIYNTFNIKIGFTILYNIYLAIALKFI